MKRFLFLLFKEIRVLFFSPTALIFMLLLLWMLAYGFETALSLYSQASVSALHNPIYATGFEPVSGIFRPTFGTYFILFSFFLPLAVIPALSREKENNSLSLLLQLPFSVSAVVLAKLIAALLFLLFSLLLILPALVIWHALGGHIPAAEFLTLCFGYFLYGAVVIAISFFSASIAKNYSAASILSLILIIASWLIDFGVDNTSFGFLSLFSNATLTHVLKTFENGLLSLSAVVYLLLLSGFFIALTVVFLHFDASLKRKCLLILLPLFALAFFLNSNIYLTKDVTESGRNSFAPSVNEALQKIPPLSIDIYLRKTDSRYRDFKQSFLEKLFLVKPHVSVSLIRGKALEKNYGLFVYHIGGKSASTYSNSEEEIFPILSSLSGTRVEASQKPSLFRGYPLVVKAGQTRAVSIWYGLLLPLLMILIYVFHSIYGRYRKNA